MRGTRKDGRAGQRSKPAERTAAARPPARPSRLQVHTAGQILALISNDGLEAGSPMREQALAERLGVSRTSVRGGLRILGLRNIVDARRHHGYTLLCNGSDIEAAADLPTSSDETLYMQIARDRVAGRLPESANETELMRRYDASRSLVLAALALLSEDGLVHRGHGREWRFREILHSPRARQESYELRLMLEPAALRLASFRPDRTELLRMRERQETLFASAGESIPSREVFHTDARFHELLASLSGNSFILTAIRQQNRLRRLIEYQSYADADRVRAWCREHIAVIDAVLAGDNALAARRMAEHLTAAQSLPAADAKAQRRKAARAPARRARSRA